MLEHYKDHIFFGEVQGQRDVVCLKNMASFIINCKRHSECKADIDDFGE